MTPSWAASSGLALRALGWRALDPRVWQRGTLLAQTILVRASLVLDHFGDTSLPMSRHGPLQVRASLLLDHFGDTGSRSLQALQEASTSSGYNEHVDVSVVRKSWCSRFVEFLWRLVRKNPV